MIDNAADRLKVTSIHKKKEKGKERAPVVIFF